MALHPCRLPPLNWDVSYTFKRLLPPPCKLMVLSSVVCDRTHGHLVICSLPHLLESSPLSQAVFCGILFQWIKPLYKVSDSVGHMVLPSGKENPYLEYISIPLEMNYCPILQWRGCTIAGWFWRQCWVRGFWLERLVGWIVLAVTGRSALRRGSPCKISHPCHQGYSVDEPIVPKMEWSTTVWLTSTIQVNLCGASSMNKVFWRKKGLQTSSSSHKSIHLPITYQISLSLMD